ncbi:MAG: hypothetical protein ABSA22_04735 [Acidimicrobiales bacterium]
MSLDPSEGQNLRGKLFRRSYLQWHIFQISVANLIVIILMVVTFAVALFAPFPGRRRRKENREHD